MRLGDSAPIIKTGKLTKDDKGTPTGKKIRIVCAGKGAGGTSSATSADDGHTSGHTSRTHVFWRTTCKTPLTSVGVSGSVDIFIALLPKPHPQSPLPSSLGFGSKLEGAGGGRRRGILAFFIVSTRQRHLVCCPFPPNPLPTDTRHCPPTPINPTSSFSRRRPTVCGIVRSFRPSTYRPPCFAAAPPT